MANGNNMTVEEMIAAGAPWEQIKARINELQREQKAKKAAEEAAKKANIDEEIATKRLAATAMDWARATGILETEKDIEEFGKVIVTSLKETAKEIREMKKFETFLTQVFGK